jgi:hypothetical protein
MSEFPKERRAARNSKVGVVVFQRQRRQPGLPFADQLANPSPQELRTKRTAVE